MASLCTFCSWIREIAAATFMYFCIFEGGFLMVPAILIYLPFATMGIHGIFLVIGEVALVVGFVFVERRCARIKMQEDDRDCY